MNRLAATVRVLVAMATVLTVVLMVWFMRRADSAVTPAGFDKSVAIVPFAMEAGDTANASPAGRIADEVANRLARVPGLRLAGPRAAAQFAGTGAAVQEIGSTLHVSTVLTGTVRQVGGRVRVTSTLSNARDGVVLWQQQYDRDARALVTVVDDITRAIAGQLQLTLRQ